MIKLSENALARHEAGHAVLAVAYERSLTSIKIDPANNCGNVEFKPSMVYVGPHAATRFAGPLSQLLKYASSVEPYRDKCLQSIIFEQLDQNKAVYEYNVLNWAHDLLSFFCYPPGLMKELKKLEIGLKIYLQRDTVQEALSRTETLLIENHNPTATIAEEMILSLLSMKDKNPCFSVVLNNAHLSPSAK